MFEGAITSVDPRPYAQASACEDAPMEAEWNFRFKVTWKSVTANLELRQVTCQAASAARSAAMATDVSLAALGAAVAAPAPSQTRQAQPRWEMVVPKMDRSDRGMEVIDRAAPASGRTPARDGYTPASIPTFATLNTSFFSRARERMRRRGRTLLTASSPGNEVVLAHRNGALPAANGRGQMRQLNAPGSENHSGPTDDNRHADREMLLSRIARKLRGNNRSADATLSLNQGEGWRSVPASDETGGPAPR